jgi:hypothetical protein
LSVDGESLSSSSLLSSSSIVLCFYVDAMDSSASSSSQIRLMSLEAIILCEEASVTKSVVLGSHHQFIYMKSLTSIPKRCVGLFSAEV